MKMVTLDECVENCPANYGGDPGSRDADALVAKVSNIDSYGEFHREFETRSFTLKELEKLTAKPGDLFVVKSSGSKKKILSGKTAIVEKDSPTPLIASNFLLLLRPIPELVEPRYLWRILNSSLSKAFIKTVVGAFTYPNLKWSTYRQHPIPLPPLPEQKRIAAILDAADALRAKRRESLEQLDQLLQSTFLEMFGDPVTNPMGWETSPLGRICDVRDGTHDSPKYVTDGYPLLTSKNFKEGRIDYAGANLISDEDFRQINRRSKVDVGDLVMPMIGTIGNPVLVKQEPNFAIKNVALIKFSSASPDNQFIHTLLCSHYFSHITSKANRGGTQKFVALKDLRGMPVPLPPLDLQKRFATIVESIEQQKARCSAQLDELDTLFSSLQARAFKGEL